MADAVLNSLNTRQLRRASLREKTWKSVSGERAMMDDRGIIPRRIRREMWRLALKRKPRNP